MIKIQTLKFVQRAAVVAEVVSLCTGLNKLYVNDNSYDYCYWE